jgi:class 3 adenylate cyclase/Tfp pilus assembly protein PilF
LITGNCLVSQPDLDSLYSVWQNESLSDSSRATAYADYIWERYSNNSKLDSALAAANDLNAYGETHDYPTAIAIAHWTKGRAYYKNYKDIEALTHYQKSLEFSDSIGNRQLALKSMQGIAYTNLDMGNYTEAKSQFENIIARAEELNQKKDVAGAFRHIGISFKRQGNYPKALEYFQQALALNEILGNNIGLSHDLNNIGVVYGNNGNLEKALEYYKRSLEISRSSLGEDAIALTLNNIGNILRRMGDQEQALSHFNRSIAISEKNRNKKLIATSLIQMGRCYKDQGDYEQAMNNFKEGLELYQEIESPYRTCDALRKIGWLYYDLGEPTKAIKACSEALEIAMSLESIEFQRSSCSCLYRAYKALGNNNEALAYHEQMITLEDSLNSEELATKLQQMEYAKEFLTDSLLQEETKRIVEIAHQQEVDKKDRTRNMLIGGGSLLLLAALGFYSRWRYVKKSRDTISKEKDRSENLLLNILPAEIAEELKEKGEAAARDFDNVSILFTDFKGFTQASEKLSATELVNEINTCFKAFDGIVGKYKIEKIKTIGDAYMCAGGLPVPDKNAAKNTVLGGLEMQAFMKARKAERDAAGLPAFEMRVGIHTGPVVAGIVGVKKFQYDIWGDTVNTASRMESSGAVGQVNISEATYEILKDDSSFTFESRGKIEAKGKGEMEMYFVSKAEMKRKRHTTTGDTL